MEQVLLADKPDAIPQIAQWYSDEWGYLGDGRTTDALELKLRTYLNRDKLPLMVLAKGRETLIAVGQLRYQEMDTYPPDSHWIGGVYVEQTHRGRGIAQHLLENIISIARKQGITRLYLQTEDITGGLYARMGWTAIEEVTYHGVDVLVMVKLI